VLCIARAVTLSAVCSPFPQAYLTHTVEQRGNHADFTIFLQPDPQFFGGVLLRLHKLWCPETGALGFGPVKLTS
jgi:hypothetical protein